MGRKKPAAREEDGVVGGGKSRKKAVVIDDDEYSIGTELSEEKSVQEEEHVAPVAGKKKGKKGNQKNLRVNDDEEEDVEIDQEIKFTGKKKPNSKAKKGGNSFAASGFALLGDEDDENSDVTKDEEDDVSEDEDANVVFTGKKKPSKSKKSGSLFTGSAFDAIGDDDDDDGDLADNSESKQQSEDEDDEPVISFTGKKKSSKSNKKTSGSIFSAAHFDGLNEGENEKESDDEDQDDMPITFSGKKKSTKSSKKKNNPSDIGLTGGGTDEEVSVSGMSIDDVADRDEDSSLIKFSGKKKPSKKKNSNSVNAADEHEQPSTSITTSKEADVPETSKNKKKKKKGGRTAQEEDDLDKILAELGETPAIVQQPQEEKEKVEPIMPQPNLAEPAIVADEGGEKDTNEETVESAAAKKKKKKKEKEKEKKAAGGKTTAAPVVEEKQAESKSKVPDKKVPKHVREMQERLARLKEAEEKKKREEEEKLRKEEEERLRLEELERIAEEKKRLKKEREKEKMLKKKQEGKLLTAKQKEEARRLEAMRNQILANAGGLPLPTGDTSRAQTKRPKYQTKKSKSHPQANGKGPSTKATEITENQEDNVSELGSVEAEKAEDVEMENLEEKMAALEAEENGKKEDEEEEEEDEWDAKSWDDADLKLPGISAFADEEEVTEKAEPIHTLEAVSIVKKEIKNAPKTSVVPNVTKEVHQNLEIKEKKQQEVKGRKEVKKEEEDDEKTLRSPICCIMGHVDTGKTKLLDCIRRTNVQEGEAGGITQQIGATYIPAENIRERTKELKADAKLNVPGLLVIDTPGHESFKNLRSRGSGLCDIAILVVDIMHGLEPQTIESLNLLRMRNTEFIVALNKVDRLYGWKTCRNAPIGKAMKLQSKDVQLEFEHRLTQIITEFKEQGLNTELYNKNKDRGETYSIVPTSAISGEGIPEMLLLLVQWAQKTMIEKLTYSSDIQCTVLEVKVIEGLGTTIDVVLVNGVLHEGDEIVVCGFQGPIHTSIRSLLTPHPMKELRVKGNYIHHKEIKAAQGIKISAQNLEHAVAGTALYVVGADDDVEEIKESVMDDMRNVMNRIDKSGEGVYVQASTLGSLEALLEFLKTPAVSIPVSGIGIGPVHKKDVMKASVMLEKKKEYATILAFDVKVTPEARELADDLGVKIFIADIIYHLFDQFKAYIDNLKEEKKKEAAEDAVFPCVLQIMPNCVFNKKDPIILGVDVLEGILKIGTPICIPQREFIDIGRISSIENNHKPVDYAKKGQKVAIKITGSNAEEQQKMFGRHFEMEDELVSRISRNSIDILKSNYRDELSNEEWRLVVKLKNLFKIQ